MSKRVALVLGSGGARGYAHIGVIEEIERRGYDIACIAGCSMGAVIGGIYAAGKLEEYRNWIESLDYLDVLRLVDDHAGARNGALARGLAGDDHLGAAGKQRAIFLHLPRRDDLELRLEFLAQFHL